MGDVVMLDFNTAMTPDALEKYLAGLASSDSVDSVTSALAHIDAHSRETWVEMAMAIKSEFGDDGFDVWDSWSQTASNYNERAARETWRSVSVSGGITIGTLFHAAKGNGWDHSGSTFASYHFSPEAQEAREARRVADEAEIRARHARGAALAKRAYADSRPLEEGETHAYLSRKNVAPAGDVRIAGPSDRRFAGSLFIPASLASGEVVAGQYIPEVGEKKAVFECPLNSAGAHFIIPGKADTVAIVEGYATGLSVFQATGWTVAVTFTSGNMPKAAQEVQKRFAGSGARFFVLGDFDSNKEAAGQKAARKASDNIGAKWLCPDISGIDGASDWNDVANLHPDGEAEVRRQLLQLKDFRVNILGTSWDDYAGPAPEYEWVVDGILPLGALVVLAARGGTGKGIATLDLGLKVASEAPPACALDTNPPMAFGNRILRHGPVVLLYAEDSRKELHRRIQALGRSRPKHPFHAIPMVDMGGVRPLFKNAQETSECGIVETNEWREWEEQLRIIKPVLVVIDPMSSFMSVDINSKPEVGQQVQNRLAALASELNCSIVISHHMNKAGKGGAIMNADDARNAIRGTSGLVDGARGAYAMWPLSEYKSISKAKKYCQALGVEWNQKRIVLGALVKDNFPGDTETHIYVRDDNGLLVERSKEIRAACANSDDVLMDSLQEEIELKAYEGIPYTLSGANDGLHERRHEMEPELAGIGRDRLQDLAKRLLDGKRVFKCAAKGKKDRKYLDVKDGPFHRGEGEIFPVGFRSER